MYAALAAIGEEMDMEYQPQTKQGKKFLLLQGEGQKIEKEQDALDIISLCAEEDTRLVLIGSERLSDDFFRLRTGLLGAVVQKLVQYSVKAVVVVNAAQIKGKAEDFLLETNRGKDFRAYPTQEQAEEWLLG